MARDGGIPLFPSSSTLALGLPKMRSISASILFLFALLSSFCVLAYVPASPTNNTEDAIAAGLNVTDVSLLHLQWFANGSYTQHISYQLAGNGSQGVTQGALVHFSEVEVNNRTEGTTTPWIALVSCDFNATDADQEIDIFTLARDKGAVSALLYSMYSEACVINPYYADPESFDQVFDIFSTQSLASARLIEYQFGQISTGQNYFTSYNSSRMNDSEATVIASINEGYAVAPGYLFATLVAHNATNASNYNMGNNGGGGSTSQQQGRSTTALAMIVLYAITGCVSALFCVVIITGAIRAIRHPERYGPRGGRYGGADAGMIQSRARGLTRAILDTFPVVKFGSQPNSEKDVEGRSEDVRTAGSASTAVPVSVLEKGVRAGNSANTRVQTQDEPSTPFNTRDVATVPVTTVGDSDGDLMGQVRPRNHVRTSREDVVPAAIGRETCPICIVDFEEGDDIRILPCEGQHRFHQQCVDPWLLELSSSCPLCRHDFLALENMLNGESEEEEPIAYPVNASESSQRRSSRFSRYVRSAIHRHRHRHGRDDQVTENNPPAPPVPQPSM
ncbi:ring finger domain [Moniliophthora roreri]|uniref:RING-type domain-containing protein n=1 Tax=Moniliophthora roreri TaxID=221103 RepID=A0A0W0FGQ0_MONRR|nr:ring finger domain [Moniliophthora roreri]